VLTALYAALPETRAGFGFAAVDDAGRTLGFISATTGVGSLFVEIGTTRLGSLLPPLLRQVLRHPMLLPRSLQTVLYPLLVGERASGPPPAELLSIMVEPKQRSHGVGAALLSSLVDECQSRAIALLDVTVDATNEGARRFYARHGFAPHHTFTLYGRDMHQLRRDLRQTPAAPRSSAPENLT
jgi:ribosomal protein S18 acetylase RimI-like enzyme